MKILLTSDIHGNYELVKAIKAKHKDCNYHLDAGDSRIPEHTLDIDNIISVRGNSDIHSNLPLMRILELDGKRFLLIHGHIQSVKYKTQELEALAKIEKADYCIYGHTHIQDIRIKDGITYINPGAIMSRPSEYAIYEDGKIVLY